MNKITEMIKNWIRLWPDIWAAPLALFGLWCSYYIFALIDPTIGTFDMGMLQALLFTAVILVVINALVFLGIENNDKGFWKYYKDTEGKDPANDLNQLTPWQRLKLFYFWRTFLFLLAVVIFQALI